MSNLSNITSKILKDAEEKSENIISKANAEKDSMISKKVTIANELASEIVKKAEIEAKSIKERIISAAKLEVRNNKLSAKQEKISEVFEKSIDSLCSMSKEEFINFVENSILSIGVEGDETLILNEAGIKVIDESFIKELNSKLNARGIDGKIKLASKTREFRGGFILEKDGIEINNTYEALVEALRDEVEYEVAGVLFN